MIETEGPFDTVPIHRIIKRGDDPRWLAWVRENQLILAFTLAVVLLAGGGIWLQPVKMLPAAETSTASIFEVRDGDSLIKAYGFDDAVTIAERLSMPLRKKELGSNRLTRISYDQARALKAKTDRNLVVAKLYVGDRIMTMRYPNGQINVKTGFVFFSPAPRTPELAER